MNIKIEQKERVVKITLDRPKSLNALNSELMQEMISTLTKLDRDPNVGCFLITGSEKAFAAGADIKEMEGKSYMDMYHEDYFSGWEAFTAIRTPKVAAVSGYALGGGCELAMMCDIIYASETAKFGQPEIKLGVIPGIGGTQRLTKMIGKSKAMDLILTGRIMNAQEAQNAGLVARVFTANEMAKKTEEIARIIASYGKTAVMAARETVNMALELGIKEGVLFERRAFHALFNTADQREGMNAFIQKRDPNFNTEGREQILNI
ncbi:enoyl-CoA hydratase-related protein [Aquimarina sp. 2201CG5-10]|uniref:enoyl-CoA hydratase-related protein n=1 Tax=Aquimarina callyspongiae TaxID=3098150 RepID=UPI002AB493E7|nr:enoyl-CoA hydratase-related protein [Aquimarina sp. 2201CG5-10]MDY8135773.1 enoyl-CoA hydratase-related protein [Aquimarina sp. 2201CG5-10]